MIGSAEYLQKVEDLLMLHRVKRMPSRKEQEAIEAYREAGVPFFLVSEAIKDTASRNREIGSFSYFVPIIDQRWKTVNLSAEARRPKTAIDVRASLDRLVTMIPESLPIRDKVVAQIQAVAAADDPEQAEKRLTDIDCRLIEWGRRSLGEVVATELGDWIDRFRWQFNNRVEISDRACFALTARIVREKLNVPRISLFTEKP